MFLVCKKWKDASHMAWYDMKAFELNFYDNFADISYDYARIHFQGKRPEQIKVGQILTRCGPYLLNLNLQYPYDSRIMSVIKNQCPKLINLTLDFALFSEKHFENAFTKMNKLKSLKVYGLQRDVFGDDRNLTHEFNIFESLRTEIEKLSFSPRITGHRIPQYVSLVSDSSQNWSSQFINQAIIIYCLLADFD